MLVAGGYCRGDLWPDELVFSLVAGGRVHLVGHSLGAAVVNLHALRWPDSVATLATVAGSHPI